MTTRQFFSTDASAPVLSGATGSLNDLLQAILVTGYGTRVAAGWTQSFSDATTKTMVWRPATGPRHYLQSQDNGPGAGTFKEARWKGFVTMTAFNTGTEPFPTVAQMATGLFVRKSATADATARPWRAVADEATLYLFIDPADFPGHFMPYEFGQFTSWKTADAYASIIAARILENTNANTNSAHPNLYTGSVGGSVVIAYAPRSYSGVGSAVALSRQSNATLLNNTGQIILGTAGQAYPNPVDAGLLLSPLYITEGTVIRGSNRGLWNPCHAKPILDQDTFSVTDGAVTRNFIALNLQQLGQCFVETGNTWDTP